MSIYYLCSITVKYPSLDDDDFNIGLAFAATLYEAFSFLLDRHDFSTDKFVNIVHKKRFDLELKI